MSQKINKEEIKKREKEIKVLYDEYLSKFKRLKNHQNVVIKEFIQKLEQNKLEDIRNKLK